MTFQLVTFLITSGGCNFTKYFSNPGIGFVYSLSDLLKYYKMYLEMMDYWDDCFPGKIYNLNYETLTEDPINEIKNLRNQKIHIDKDNLFIAENVCLILPIHK